jgi:hypothetical protein
MILYKYTNHLQLLQNILKELMEIEYTLKTIQFQLANYIKPILLRF